MYKNSLFEMKMGPRQATSDLTADEASPLLSNAASMQRSSPASGREHNDPEKNDGCVVKGWGSKQVQYVRCVLTKKGLVVSIFESHSPLPAASITHSLSHDIVYKGTYYHLTSSSPCVLFTRRTTHLHRSLL